MIQKKTFVSLIDDLYSDINKLNTKIFLYQKILKKKNKDLKKNGTIKK